MGPTVLAPVKLWNGGAFSVVIQGVENDDTGRPEVPPDCEEAGAVDCVGETGLPWGGEVGWEGVGEHGGEVGCEGVGDHGGEVGWEGVGDHGGEVVWKGVGDHGGEVVWKGVGDHGGEGGREGLGDCG